jgi:hypothetical protein
MCMLSNIKRTYGIAAVVINQVNYSPYPDIAKPTGGNVMAHTSILIEFLLDVYIPSIILMIMMIKMIMTIAK